jgi:hypothetical protein
MSTLNTAYLAMVLIAFVAFMATLAFGSIFTATAKEDAEKAE